MTSLGMIGRLRRALTCLVVAVVCVSLVGCGGTKIKDYDEAVGIPDVPLAGGAEVPDDYDEQPMADDRNASTAEVDGDNAAADRRQPAAAGAKAEPATPTEAKEFD